jgi:SAM-dependent methyltransferase
MPEITAPDIPQLRGPVPLSHLLLQRFVHPGDRVVDATCGNGHDTLLLAGLAGPSGRVWAFDIQPEALEATAARLAEADIIDAVVLIHAGHEAMAAHCYGPVKAVVFNLGYLPGGDRTIVTRPESTLAGLEQALGILEPGGVVIITLYPGHEGGQHERTLLETRLVKLPPAGFHVWRMGQMNVPTTAPYLILVQKAA